MFRRAVKEDLAQLFIAYKKYLKEAIIKEEDQFTSDDQIVDFLNSTLHNDKAIIVVDGEKRIEGFMIMYQFPTPFLKIKNRIWLEVAWKEKGKLKDFTGQAKMALRQVCKAWNAEAVLGMISDKRPDLERFYRRIGCNNMGSIMTWMMN